MSITWLLFSFKGRIGRGLYWAVSLFQMAILTGFEWWLDSVQGPWIYAALIAVLIIAWSCVAVQAKRWHDTDRSGWWVLINLAPCFGSLWAFIVNGFFAGTPGMNRFD